MYHNDGNGHFTEISAKIGLNKPGKGLGLSIADFDRDGKIDIAAANDSMPEFLYHNKGDGTFEEVGLPAEIAVDGDGRTYAGMGIAFQDYNNDGLPDLVITNLANQKYALYRNNGDGTFADKTFAAGLGINTDALGWGAAFADVDNDGWPDLLVVNGHVYPEVDSEVMGTKYREPRFLYYNLGNGKFKDLSKSSGPGLTEPRSGRGLAIGDLFNDGRLDAVVNNLSDTPMLLVNVAASNNHWLGVRLIGTTSNKDAIGSRVTIHGAKRAWVDEVRSGSSFNSSNDLRLHFGLGASSELSSIEVRWPNGRTEVFDPPQSLDHVIDISEGTGRK